jgi:hypothetical protein
VTLDLPADSPILSLPWIITFGPMSDDEEWEPVVCGPYERPHAMALAGSVVADEELMAVVEPLQPYVTVDQIRGEITTARLAAELEGKDDDDTFDTSRAEPQYAEPQYAEPSQAPGPDELRDGFARIAARLIRS